MITKFIVLFCLIALVSSTSEDEEINIRYFEYKGPHCDVVQGTVIETIKLNGNALVKCKADGKTLQINDVDVINGKCYEIENHSIKTIWTGACTGKPKITTGVPDEEGKKKTPEKEGKNKTPEKEGKKKKDEEINQTFIMYKVPGCKGEEIEELSNKTGTIVKVDGEKLKCKADGKTLHDQQNDVDIINGKCYEKEELFKLLPPQNAEALKTAIGVVSGKVEWTGACTGKFPVWAIIDIIVVVIFIAFLSYWLCWACCRQKNDVSTPQIVQYGHRTVTV
jgi:hypothetical protein